MMFVPSRFGGMNPYGTGGWTVKQTSGHAISWKKTDGSPTAGDYSRRSPVGRQIAESSPSLAKTP
jgi:hypothetical protein